MEAEIEKAVKPHRQKGRDDPGADPHRMGIMTPTPDPDRPVEVGEKPQENQCQSPDPELGAGLHPVVVAVTAMRHPIPVVDVTKIEMPEIPPSHSGYGIVPDDGQNIPGDGQPVFQPIHPLKLRQGRIDTHMEPVNYRKGT